MSKNNREHESLLGGLAEDITGRGSFKRSKWGYFTGASALKESTSSISGAMADGKRRGSALLKMALSPSKGGKAVHEPSPDDRIRFEQSIEANGKSQVDIENSISVTHRQFLAYGSVAVVYMAANLIWMYFGGTYFSGAYIALEFVLRMFPIPALAALMLRASYTNHMLRNRSLRSLRSYLTSRDVWPKSTATMKPEKNVMTSKAKSASSLTGVVLLGAVAAMIALTGHAYADIANANSAGVVERIFNLSGENPDLFMRLLGYVMPEVGPVPTSPVADSLQFQAIRWGFFAFSSSLMFIGMVVFGWQLMSSVVASAKEGSLLGRTYHELWAPVRLVTGFGMLAPMANGLCAAQVVVLYLVALGGNLANEVWRPYMEVVSTNSSDGSSNSAISTMVAWNAPESVNSVQQLFMKELCNETLKVYAERNSQYAPGSAEIVDYGRASSDTSFKRQDINVFRLQNMHQKTGHVYHRADYGEVCGFVETRWEDPQSLLQRIRDAATLDAIAFWREDTSGMPSDMNAALTSATMGEAQLKGLMGIQPIVNSVAREVAASYQSMDAVEPFILSPNSSNANREKILGRLLEARNAYLDEMQKGAVAVYNYFEPIEGDNEEGRVGYGKLDELRRVAGNQGWAGAGTLYVTIARVSNQLFERSTESAHFGNPQFVVLSNNPDLMKVMDGTVSDPGLFSHAATWMTMHQKDLYEGFSMPSVTAANDETSTLGKALTSMFGSGVEFFENDRDPNPLNPMQDLIQMGNTMFNTGFVMFGLSQASDMALSGDGGSENAAENMAKRVAEANPAGKGASVIKKTIAGALAGLSTIGSFVGIALMVAGIVHSFVLPFIPYILVTFFVASMLLLVVEALVAAPIWAFMHIRMDGDEFVGQVQRPGYMIAFNLILRPSLMIFGLILSYVVFGAMTYFIQVTFVPAMYGLGASSAIGLFGALMMILIVTYLHFMLAIRAFQLITRLPDRVTRWFGQGGEHLGEESDGDKTTAFMVGQSHKVENIVRPLALKPAIGGAAAGMAGAAAKGAMSARPDAQPKGRNTPET